MLTYAERQVLAPLLQEPRVVVSPTPLILEQLRGRGYVRFAKGFTAGGIPTGEVVAVLTEAGQQALEARGESPRP